MWQSLLPIGAEPLLRQSGWMHTRHGDKQLPRPFLLLQLHNRVTEVVNQPLTLSLNPSSTDKLSTTPTTSSTLKIMNWEASANDTVFARGADDHTTYNVTMVSAYFDLGSFAKGTKKNLRGKSHYEDWFTKFGALHNPLVFYTDSDTFAQIALRVRGGELAALTRVIKVSRDQLWSFQLREKVARIYAQSSYPKHLPNTVIPEYSCAMHAKFEVMNDTIRNRYFPSSHYAWIDIGCFRDLSVTINEVLSLVPPKDLDPSRIMYSEVFSPALTMLPSKIFRENIVWVGGASFVGRAEVVLEFTEQYRRATVRFLEEKGLSNSDQQVIYSMFTREGRNLVKPTVELQIIHRGWFGVGYHCLNRKRVHYFIENDPAMTWFWTFR
ncbi:uncharacterized protein LOC112560272 isoform X3 [Pomacea canaliculata]|uniref:uncharacterized protein LOC112560272 isoform X3 n=1 Tax=Pomacea canaliculata TaxID=400727 RepID=UPI000D73E174|nr:uncharacterized protein LOC112560272 isoform X3 [Pomacea canaliculata]